MRNLIDIVKDVKDGKKPEYDELRYAVVVLEVLSGFDLRAIMRLAEGEKKGKRKFLSYSSEYQYNESFNRRKIAMNKPPMEWLGKNNDPDSKEYQERRKMSQNIFDKIQKKVENDRNRTENS